MPSAPWTFKLTYWGTTGSFPRVLSPDEVSRKIARTIHQLGQLGKLSDVCTENIDEDELMGRISMWIPFEMRSTYGGNTTCLEVCTPQSLLVLDAGSGLQAWSAARQREWNSPDYQGPRDGHVFMTHAHLDHTCSLAFADLFYDSRNSFTIWATDSVIEHLQAMLCPQNGTPNPLLPITLQHLSGIRELKPIPPSGEFFINGTRITTLSLNHPGNSIGYRFEHDERRVVIVTDHESTEVPDRRVAEFGHRADLMYLDAQYLQSEYDGRQAIGSLNAQPRRGWGHSSIEASITTAIAAEVKELHIGHHDPHRADAELAQLEQFAETHAKALQRGRPAEQRCVVRLARESSTWTIH